MDQPGSDGLCGAALEEKKAKFGYSVDTEKTAAAKPFQARMRKDEEERVIRKPRTCRSFWNTGETKERRPIKKGCDHEHGEPRAKTQGYQQFLPREFGVSLAP